MANSWSLLYDVMYGPEDEAKLVETNKGKFPATDNTTGIFEYPEEGVEIHPGIKVSYNPPDFTTLPSTGTIDLGSGCNSNLHIQATSPYNDGWTQQATKEELETMSDSRYKYHEKEILKDVEEYVSRTYNGHYTGTKHEYRNVQTIDLMASRDLASDFCQANILKYGSRYGSKDGRNKKDLMKVIHYAMLLLHFDEHYGKPSITSGNIDHNMP